MLAVVHLAASVEVTSEAMWRSEIPKHGTDSSTRPCRRTFLSPVLLCQGLMLALYKRVSQAIGDHVFRGRTRMKKAVKLRRKLRPPPNASDIPPLHDAFVSTTPRAGHLRVRKHGIMASLAKPLIHKHSADCGKHSLGNCRFGFPQLAVRRTRRKTARELWSNRSKNRFHVRRRDDALMMGVYNPKMLRRWCDSYILGYVLKRDTARRVPSLGCSKC